MFFYLLKIRFIAVIIIYTHLYVLFMRFFHYYLCLFICCILCSFIKGRKNK